MSRLIFTSIASAALAACFSPTFPQGIPCSTEGECPGDQICASDNRCYDEGLDAGINPNAALASLEVSLGTLDPPFNPAVASYTITLGIGAQALEVTPTASAADATILVNSTGVDSGSTSAPLTLNLGDNLIEIRVTAGGDATSRYTINTNRGAGTEQAAYAKASNTGTGDLFGNGNLVGNGAVAIHGDTLVVGASRESSGASGVGADQTDNSSTAAGAVYVFVRNGASWSQQAYIKASNADANDQFGGSLALDGDTLVVGAALERSNATGVGGVQSDNSVMNAGAVYVFTRNGTTWTQQAYVKASNTGLLDLFGTSVALDGDTLVVGARGEDSNTIGVNGLENDNSASASGAAYIFVRQGATWSQQAYLKASNTQQGDNFGESVTISGDTVAIGATNEDSGATGVNGTQGDEGASNAGAVYVFTRNGSSWAQQAYLKASNTGAGDDFGIRVSLSEDTLAIGASREGSNTTGINGDETNDLADAAGAVYVFGRTGTTWAQEAYVKASNTENNDLFGSELALSSNALLVGAHGEDSQSSGTDGDQSNNAASGAGAAYLFVRDNGTWSQQLYIKASNPNASDSFGSSVSVSNNLIAIGAGGEESAATGIGGDQADNSANAAGAVYVFE